MATKVLIHETPEQKLVHSFEHNGCMRVPNPKRRKAEPESYKMGYEIRLVAFTKRELADLRRTIRAAGLKPGKPFAKVNRWIQPIYGREAKEHFDAILKEFGQIKKKSSKKKSSKKKSGKKKSSKKKSSKKKSSKKKSSSTVRKTRKRN